MLSSHLLKTIKPLITELTTAQRLELIRWIAENPAEDDQPAPSDTWESRISAEAAAWYARPDADREPYAGQYVAVLRGEVLDHDSDRLALAQRIRARYPETPVLITAAEARTPREFQIRSPRLVRLSEGA
jgi:hypothetical protein